MRRADIRAAAWRRVWAGPTVRITVLMASRTSMTGATSYESPACAEIHKFTSEGGLRVPGKAEVNKRARAAS
ncbi:hypothetical protein Scel_34290 [Streptomyces cellostaticus]|nr:hypothetical protein Scel_34290 [Streptomyces cellostaticus]